MNHGSPAFKPFRLVKNSERPVESKDSLGPFVIEKGIPLPKGRREIYPWRLMEVGDSIFFPDRGRWEINPIMWKAGKRHGFKFSLRKWMNGVRVWRVE